MLSTLAWVVAFTLHKCEASRQDTSFCAQLATVPALYCQDPVRMKQSDCPQVDFPRCFDAQVRFWLGQEKRNKTTSTTLAKKNRYSRDIHEVDPQCDHVISRDIDFDLQRELATRSYRESCRTEARYRTISHDRTVDQPHEFLGCNDFFGQGSSTVL